MLVHCEENMNFGTTELIIILAIILLLFGSKKLPELSKSIGQSLKELRKGMNDTPDETKKDNNKETTPR